MSDPDEPKIQVSKVCLKALDPARRQFFDERAESWMDRCYRNPATGCYDRHAGKFARLMSLLPICSSQRILDVGCGSGVLVPHLLRAVGRGGCVFEMDYAERMVAAGRRGVSTARVQHFVGDAHSVPIRPGTFDGILCFSCFPHFHDKRSALAALVQALRPGGWLSVAHFDSSADINRLHRGLRGSPVAHDRLPETAAMRALLQQAGLGIQAFTDAPGFYFILALRAG